MSDVISDYQKWKQQGEDLRVQAKQAMEARFRTLLTEAAQISEEYRADFGAQFKPPVQITAFRYKTGAKAKKPAAKKAAAAAAAAARARREAESEGRRACKSASRPRRRSWTTPSRRERRHGRSKTRSTRWKTIYGCCGGVATDGRR